MKNPNGPSKEEMDDWQDAISDKASGVNRSAWKTWNIKAVYSHGETHLITQTVTARTKREAETKALPFMRGKCLGFIVYLPNP